MILADINDRVEKIIDEQNIIKHIELKKIVDDTIREYYLQLNNYEILVNCRMTLIYK